VTVLLATWNGAANLRAQLDSYRSQTHPPARLIVSDDGSQDDTRAILHDFAASAPGFAVDILDGPRRGGAQNFLHLLQAVPEGTDWVALSDQDDVWLPDKIARGLRMLDRVPAGQPGLVGGRSYVCNADLEERRLSPLPRRAPSFRHALVQNFAGGNTMMLNRAGLDLARAAAAEAGRVVVHDWWLYQIIAGVGGEVVFDAAPLLLYRQHTGNQIGANSGVEAKLKRLRWMLRGRFRRWNAINLAALRASAHRFTPENRALLEDFARLQRADLIGRLTILRRLGLYRNGVQGMLSLWLAAALGRI
jgi:glycosyltransferase involved in cell wall biosynthesis